MAKKSKKALEKKEIIHKPAIPQPITETIEKNYMPYVMSVIVSRAIPEIDGLKPAHRKLLYTMYKMGLLTGNRTKSANIVGQTMKLNPHGDAAIYETMVRLTRGNEALLHPLVDSKGSFGKQYSSEMKYAASRYTEAKLDPFCAELFRGIDKNAVDFIDNYDGTMQEPVLLPTSFPNVLVTPNKGIAVGMASEICSFNLAEVCDATVAILKNPKTSVDKILEIMKAPDFPGGGTIIYNRDMMRQIYETGSGSVKIRARYVYDKAQNCIDIIQIPYSTSIELIMKKLTELIKEGKIKEIVDFRDEIDLSGFKLTLDLRRGTDPDKLMTRLYKMTPLEDSFKCNFNVLINGSPRQMGVVEILTEWIKFRMQCCRRELNFDLKKKKDKLHLLLGLGKILLDIDKAIAIIRGTEKDSDVIPNLMKGFNIDEVQADYIADIKLRNLNREFIINRISEIEGLQQEIAQIEAILADELKLKGYIAKQLGEVKKKYGKPRVSMIQDDSEVEEYVHEEHIEKSDVHIYMTREGYFKRITPQSLRGNDEQKVKEGDKVVFSAFTDTLAELIVFTDQCKVFKTRVSEFDNCKASDMGEFMPAKLGMDPGEKPIFIKIITDYPEKHNMVFIFENGKAVRVPITAYQTKAARKKLIGAYSDASPIVAAFYEDEKKPYDLLLVNNQKKAIVVKTSLIPIKTNRSSAGTTVFTCKKGQKLTRATDTFSEHLDNTGYKRIKIPATGSAITEKDIKKIFE
ncbi:MAG: topoisomerase IV [Clostridia bacterium]|nr:topoisomerase IV [Clostridia bacterium]